MTLKEMFGGEATVRTIAVVFVYSAVLSLFGFPIFGAEGTLPNGYKALLEGPLAIHMFGVVEIASILMLLATEKWRLGRGHDLLSWFADSSGHVAVSIGVGICAAAIGVSAALGILSTISEAYLPYVKQWSSLSANLLVIVLPFVLLNTAIRSRSQAAFARVSSASLLLLVVVFLFALLVPKTEQAVAAIGVALEVSIFQLSLSYWLIPKGRRIETKA